MKNISFTKFLLWLILVPLLSRISRFKNIHKGQVVYILADSAEIKLYDLKLFDNHPMICFNRSFILSDIINRKSVTYNLFGEPFYFYKNKLKRNQAEMLYLKDKISNSPNASFIHFSNILSLFSKRVIYFYHQLPFDYYTKLNNKKHFKNFQWTGATAISIAIYMGFSKIILVGFSVHSKSVKNHWFHYGLGREIDWDRYEWKDNRTHAGIDLDDIEGLAEIYALVPYNNVKSSFRIINYENFFATKIKYTEFVDLVDASYVEILKNFDYKT